MAMRFDPFEQLRDFQRAINAFGLSDWLGSGLSAGGVYPLINISSWTRSLVPARRGPPPTRQDHGRR